MGRSFYVISSNGGRLGSRFRRPATLLGAAFREGAGLIGISNQIKPLVKREPAELLPDITEGGKILGSRSDAVNWLGTLTPLKGSTRI